MSPATRCHHPYAPLGMTAPKPVEPGWYGPTSSGGKIGSRGWKRQVVM
jgi:hypothetical protein